MSKKEVVLVIFIVVVGLVGTSIYNVSREIKEEGFSLKKLISEGITFQGESHSFVETAEMDGEGVTAVKIENAHGKVEVKAAEGTGIRMTLEKVVYMDDPAKAETFADGIKPIFSKRDGLCLITTNRDSIQDRKPSFKTHISVEMPVDVMLTVKNRHGDVGAVKIGKDVEMDLAFADVEASELGGNLVVKDKHGNVKLRDVAGNARIINEHGGIDVSSLGGGLEITAEHGDVNAEFIGGDMNLETGFAEIDVRDVKKNLSIRAPHSEIRIRGIGGNGDIENSHNGIRAALIGGDISIASRHGGIELESVDGNVRISATHGDITLRDILGVSEITGEHCGVESLGFFGGGTVATTHDSVEIAELSGSLEATVNHGGVTVGAVLEAAPVTIATGNGDIGITFKDTGPFDINAETRFGKIKAPAGFTVEKETTGATASGGEGAIPVKLAAQHGDITIGIRKDSLK